MMWVYRRTVPESANKAVICGIGSKTVIDLTFCEIVVSRIERIRGSEKVGVDEGNECRVGGVAQRPEPVDEHQPACSARACAHRPEIQPSLSVGLELRFTSELRHQHVGAEVFVVPALCPGE